MKNSLPIAPPPSLWPQNKTAVLEICQSWFDPALVAIDKEIISAFPFGEIAPPTLGDTNLERPVGAVDLQEAAQYALAMNAINYMFWDTNADGKFVRYQKDGLVGALAMGACFQKAWDDPNSVISKARQGYILTPDDIVSVFGEIPEVESRVVILNEVLGSQSLHKIAQKMQDIADVQACFDTTLAYEVAQCFPIAYGDQLLKKSQLAVSAVWREACQRGSSSVCDLTAFADYQIPNVLRALGILVYSADLAERIDRGDLLLENSVEEKAIRAASVLAVEELAQQQNVSVADVDYWIWLKRKEPTTPFHLTKTTAY